MEVNGMNVDGAFERRSEEGVCFPGDKRNR